VMLISGCVALVAGTAAGVGVYSYVNGELKRSYPESYEKVYNAALASLKSLKIEVLENESDRKGATIRGQGVDDLPIWVKVSMIAPKITEVSVRSGVMGVWDKNVSELIHANIAQRLS